MCVFVYCMLVSCSRNSMSIKKNTQHRKNYVNSQISVIYVAIVLNMEFRNIFLLHNSSVYSASMLNGRREKEKNGVMMGGNGEVRVN